MTKPYRPFFFLALLAVVGTAQAATNWSDPASWPNHKVPAAGDKVTIGRDKDVVLDVSPPALGGLSIDGKLTFSNNADLELTTEWVMVHGELAIGTEANPYTHKATITLTDNVKNEQMMGMGDRGIMLSGGTLNLHGDRTNTWSKLDGTAAAGATSIKVTDVGNGRTYAAKTFTQEQQVSAIVVSYYWHFVDVVWIGLFTTIYLIR